MTTTEDLYQQAIDKYREIRDEHYEWRALADPRHLDAGVRAVVDLVLAARDEPTADGEALAQLVRDVRDGQSHSVTIDGVLIAPCDDRGLVEARHARKPLPWEVLREAAVIAYREGSDSTGFLDVIADRLEAAHRAEQEKTEPEKLIEQAAKTLAYAVEPNDKQVSRDEMWNDYLMTFARIRYRNLAAALVDAGWRPSPELKEGEV